MATPSKSRGMGVGEGAFSYRQENGWDLSNNRRVQRGKGRGHGRQYLTTKILKGTSFFGGMGWGVGNILAKNDKPFLPVDTHNLKHARKIKKSYIFSHLINFAQYTFYAPLIF